MVEKNFSRIRQIYLGLTTLGVASTLFKSFCPPEILNYKDEHDFIQAELNVVTGRRYFTYQSRLRDLLSHIVEPMRARAAEVIGTELIETREQNPTPRTGTPRPLVWESCVNQNRIPITDALQVLYRAQNECRVIARSVIAILYSIGFAFLGWSSIVIFARVIKAIIGFQ